MKKMIAMLLLPILLLAAGCNSSPPEEDLGEDYIMGTDQQYYFYLIMGIYANRRTAITGWEQQVDGICA